MPTPQTVGGARLELQAIRRPVRDALRRGELPAAVHLVDQVILRGALGLTESRHAELVTAHALMSARRVARGPEPAGSATRR